MAAQALGMDDRGAAQLAKDHGLFAEREKKLLVGRGELQSWHNRLVKDERLLRRLWELRRWTLRGITRLRIGFDGERIVFPIRSSKEKLVGVVRYHPNPQGVVKSLAAPGSRRDLFPAPESIAWKRPVFIVEGEPDSTLLWSLGLPAVGVPGVSSWRPEWGQRFSNRRVVVMCDCDPQGRDLAERVKATVSQASVVDLEPGRDDGFDVGDWVRESEPVVVHRALERLVTTNVG